MGIKVNVHIKINTGLNRIGISPNMALGFLKYISNLPNLHLE